MHRYLIERTVGGAGQMDATGLVIDPTTVEPVR
jgi:hypothetical protein